MSTQLAPDRRLRLGILGCADIATGRVLPAAPHASRVEVAAIASRDSDRARMVASRFGIPRAHGSYEALLADAQIDAIYNPLPNSLHARWSIAAAEAGKHVLCEKPLAVSLAEARTMAQACKANGVLLMEAFMYRHHPQHYVARELLATPALGPLRHVRATFSFLLGQPAGNIRLLPNLAGGVLMDVGCYTINLVRWMVNTEPIAVHAVQRQSGGHRVDTSLAMLLEFPDGMTATLDASFEQFGGGRYELICERGRITVPSAFTPGNLPVTVSMELPDHVQTRRIGAIDQYGLELDHFADSVRAGHLLQPAEDGVANTAVVEAVARAMREQRRVLVEQR